MPGRQLPDDIEAVRAFDEPVQLLTGPAHAFAAARAVTPAELVGHRIWMPGIVPGTEWAAYYDDLAAAFGLTIEVTGPDFGTEPLLDTIADPRPGDLRGRTDPPGLARRPRPAPHRPAGSDPVYPHSLLWHRDNPHPALTALRDHLAAARPATATPGPGRRAG